MNAKQRRLLLKVILVGEVLVFCIDLAFAYWQEWPQPIWESVTLWLSVNAIILGAFCLSAWIEKRMRELSE